MKRLTLRMLSVLLVLVMVVSTFSMTFAQEPETRKNTAARHAVCTSLSSQAKSYYTGSYTFDVLSNQAGGTSNCLTSVDSQLYKSLATLMSSTMTNSVSYKSLTSHWPTTDNNILFYSDSTSSNYNREHVWPKSRASFHESNGGCDLHHLRPTNANVNSTRGNLTMGNVRGKISGYSTYSYEGKTVLYYSNSADLVEVNDNIKGDVARIFLYVYCRWGERNLFMRDPNPKTGSNDSGGNNGMKVIESLDTLLQWCHDDPVDQWEMARNDECQKVQGNRNVFIDYPEYAWLLFGESIPSDMTTPSGKAKEQGVSYTITALSEDTTHGTVSLSGRTVTATPAEGYTVSGYTLNPTNAATVTQSGNVFTLSGVKADCTITIHFAAKTPATITYHVPDGVTVNGVTSSYLNTVVKLASVTGKPNGTDYLFYCWASAPVEETTKAPYGQVAGTNITLTKTEYVYYGVFAKLIDGVWTYNSNPLPETACAHAHTSVQHLDATCTEAGYDKTVCDDCGVTLSTTVLPALGHDFVKGVCTRCGAADPDYNPECTHENTKKERTEPTCTEAGEEKTVCTDCGAVISTTVLPATGHDFEDGVCVDCGAKQGLSYDNFTDMEEDAWYRNHVTYALDNGLMDGIGEGLFDPNGSLTRAMLVTILYRYEGEPTVDEDDNWFDDVPGGEWYTKAVVWAAAKGIVKGTGRYTFEPDTEITREQIATILFRYAGEPKGTGDVEDFPDASHVSGYAISALEWAIGEGIIGGSDGYLLPQNFATRAECAKMLHIYFTK